jgi:Leucine-rich repeat (LRR) protein
LTGLRKLNFGDNQISVLHDDWFQLFAKQLNNLEELDLSKNQLTKIPQFCGQFQKLQMLDLSENGLFKLPGNQSEVIS